MMTPVVHLNGTSKQELLEPLHSAYEALDAAYSAIKRCAPNGRDYYPISSTAIYEAMHEHERRLKAIDDVKDEIDELIGAIDPVTSSGSLGIFS